VALWLATIRRDVKIASKYIVHARALCKNMDLTRAPVGQNNWEVGLASSSASVWRVAERGDTIKELCGLTSLVLSTCRLVTLAEVQVEAETTQPADHSWPSIRKSKSNEVGLVRTRDLPSGGRGNLAEASWRSCIVEASLRQATSISLSQDAKW
jgi:hypothetical protein